MQKWEYLFVEAEGAWNPKVRYINHKEVADWRNGPPFHEYINQLGEEGWEAVNYDHYGQVLLFKRQKTGDIKV
jgi:hypothetical protein